MLGTQLLNVKKRQSGTLVKGKHTPGVEIIVPMEISIQPSTSKEMREILDGGERNVELYKGYVELSQGDVLPVSKRLATVADEVFYDESWWTVIKSDKYGLTTAHPHRKFFMTRVS